jgi:hypothetical protein
MTKWLKRICLGILLLFILLFAFVFLRSVIPVTVQDRELQLERANIPAGQNAFDTLQTAATNIWWPEEKKEVIFDLVSNTNWNDSLAATVLANNRESLAGWDAACKMPDLQVPEVFHPDNPMSYLSDWKRLAHVAEIRENFLMHAGQDQEAFDQMVNHIKLGRRMQNSRGPLICYLVGTAVNNLGLMQMRYWVGKAHLTPEQLKNYIRQLEQQEPADSSNAYANTMRAEYHFSLYALEDLRNGRVVDDQGNAIPRPSKLLPTINYSKTKAKFAEAYQMLVAAAPQTYKQAKLPLLEDRPGLASMIFSGNLAGEAMYEMLLPAVEASFQKKVHSDVSLQATRAILALRAYQLTHGNLPKDWSALVPEFFDKVPVDDFDGQPLRYSPDRKIVYSVGKNLKDDGGDDRSLEEKNHELRHLDVVFPIEF